MLFVYSKECLFTDAHEFMSCMLDIIRSLSFKLQTAAADMGITYTCPVCTHIYFEMLSTRTCQGCGCQSMREDTFINLSLDMMPAHSQPVPAGIPERHPVGVSVSMWSWRIVRAAVILESHHIITVMILLQPLPFFLLFSFLPLFLICLF
ncbi:ubiquitin carboxyl-terminal hydrolase 37-like [Amphiprion ocellaris]|uniref:ubiquitin carboxyl-terminal hydrolase 37-like n=1 Tax=Amphiprion ocellaris TaxID=80972 RepID=UPI00241111BD|nr:ubiquitin carboxyl-terminal hydrolase 37-like [Amphiprion ocellaris]